MKITKDFINITAADFIVRSAYQMGKTPLLPIFAATLGASGAFLGLIVSVSTVTGMILKPAFGILSDRSGRRLWLLIGTAFFVLMPFLYRFVHTPDQLFLMRLVHGLATAIYGPVTLAYISEMRPDNVAESLGWFGMARSGGYIVGPALAGWLLLYVDSVVVFSIIGVISALALVPVIMLQESKTDRAETSTKLPVAHEVVEALRVASKTPAIWLAGGMEAITFIALYTVKVFLPVFALDAGINVALIGLFFSVQEATHILIKPFGGKLADRIGHLLSVIIGMVIFGIGLAILPMFTGVGLFVPSMLTGMAQAFIFPSTVALISKQIPRSNLGAGMGFLGTMQNFGKVIGPIIGGAMIQFLGFEPVLYLLAMMLVGGAALIAVLLSKIHANPFHFNTKNATN